jgi:tripartite-type tricarboxylate transporter receptor subunit TctC
LSAESGHSVLSALAAKTLDICPRIASPERARDSMKKTLAIAFAAALFASAPAAAQDWPTKTVKIVVPFGPGSTPDMVARLIADRLQQKLGQTFVIENKPGASGNLGTDAVAKAEPDGATIGISIGGPLAINTLLFSKLPYDPAKDSPWKRSRSEAGRRSCTSPIPVRRRR